MTICKTNSNETGGWKSNGMNNQNQKANKVESPIYIHNNTFFTEEYP